MKSCPHIRNEIGQIIASITPFDSQEQMHIDFVKGWLNSEAEIFRIEKPDNLKFI
jgi:hypothetical protein